MRSQLSRRDRRTLATGIVILAALVLFARGLPAWRRWDAVTRAGATEMAAEAARAEGTVRDLPAMLDSLQVRRARFVALQRNVLGGASPAGAAAALASLVSDAAMRSGVQLGSVQVRPDSAGEETFLRASVTVEGTGDLPSITRMLALLEGGTELAAVRTLSISQPNPGGLADQPEALRVEMTVEALVIARPAALPRDSATEPDRDLVRQDDLPATDGPAAALVPGTSPAAPATDLIFEPTP